MKKTSKELREKQAAITRAKRASYGKMVLVTRVDSWSARMPAYCYTSLCSVP